LPIRRPRSENFPFAAIKPIEIAGKTVSALRLSYVGEQGWELHMKYEDGLAVWDALRATGVMAVGVETYANSRRMEKSLRLQNADLLTQYNLLKPIWRVRRSRKPISAARPKHLEYKAREHQPAMLCTLVMTDNTDAKGVARYPVGILPVMDPETGETLVDELGRRSYTTSIAYGRPSARTSRSPICRRITARWGASSASSISPRPIRSKLRRSATRRFTIRKTSSRGADRLRVTPMNDRAVKPDRSRLTGRSFFVL
jgi:hypothetical protein